MTRSELNLPAEGIQKAHSAVKDGFSSFFSGKGYSILPSAPLIPQNDPTVVFTGATITPLKHYLVEGVPSPGVAIIQNCLRTKRHEQMYDMSIIPEWTHYFTMLGILAAPDQKEQVAQNAMEYIVNHLHIPQKKIKVLATEQDKDLTDPWRKAGFEIEEDTQPIDNFRWKYGAKDTVGRGISFEIQNDNLPPRELGNIVSVESPDGTVKGYEFGFGLESYLASQHGAKKPMEVSLMSAAIPYQEGLQEKILDTLTAIAVIGHHGIEPSGGSKAQSVQQRLVKGLSYMLRKSELPHALIEKWANAFEKVEFGSEGKIGGKILEWVTAYNTKLEQFKLHAENQVYAINLRSGNLTRLPEKLRSYGLSIGIATEDLNELLQLIIQ